MAKFDWKGLVRKVAPAIGVVLGGPLGGVAVKALSEGLLGHGNGTESDIEAALASGSPDLLLKLKEIDKDFELKMAQLNIDIYALEISDRTSARQLFSVNYWPQIILTTVFATGYFAVLAFVMRSAGDYSDTQQVLINTLLGVLTASLVQIMNFWFGSSHSNQQTTEALANSSPSS